MQCDRRLVVELVRIAVDPLSKRDLDEYGFEWRKFFRHLRPIHILEKGKVSRLPPSLQEVLIEMPVSLCTSPEYRWHFATDIGGKPILYTLSARRTKEVEEGRFRFLPKKHGD